MIGFMLEMGGGRSYPGKESRGGRGFRERFWTELSDMWRWEILKRPASTFALHFGRRVALASCWMFKLVGRNHDEVGVS